MQNLTYKFIIHLLMNGKSGIVKKQTENIGKAIDQFPWAMRFTNTRIFFYKKPVYKKPRTRYPQITPNLRNFKNCKKNGILT